MGRSGKRATATLKTTTAHGVTVLPLPLWHDRRKNARALGTRACSERQSRRRSCHSASTYSIDVQFSQLGLPNHGKKRSNPCLSGRNSTPLCTDLPAAGRNISPQHDESEQRPQTPDPHRFGPPCCSCLSLPARWAIVRWRITGMWAHLFFSCVLIWLTSSASSGLVRGENRFTRLPSRSIRNFSKFQLTLPFPAGLASLLVKYL